MSDGLSDCMREMEMKKMKENGMFIRVFSNQKQIWIRGSVTDKQIETNLPCPFDKATCTEACDKLKFEQLTDGYAENEFDVTLGCIDNMYCSLYVED